MENYAISTYDLYSDIKNRTGGEIYIGVLGPRAHREIHLHQALHGRDGAALYGR